jgi:hypothetical protein
LDSSGEFEPGFVASHEAVERFLRLRNLAPVCGKFLWGDCAIIAHPLFKDFLEDNWRAQNGCQNLCRFLGSPHRAGNEHISLDFSRSCQAIPQKFCLLRFSLSLSLSLLPHNPYIETSETQPKTLDKRT